MGSAAGGEVKAKQFVCKLIQRGHMSGFWLSEARRGPWGVPVFRRHGAPAGSDIQRAAAQPASCCVDPLHRSQPPKEEEDLCGVRMYSLSSEELHPQQGKHHDEEEEEEEQTDDGLHGVQEGDDQIPQRVPVPVRKQREYSHHSEGLYRFFTSWYFYNVKKKHVLKSLIITKLYLLSQL